jgi:hypothetical protein
MGATQKRCGRFGEEEKSLSPSGIQTPDSSTRNVARQLEKLWGGGGVDKSVKMFIMTS